MGIAVGRAVRAPDRLVVVITLSISLAVYSGSGNFNIWVADAKQTVKRAERASGRRRPSLIAIALVGATFTYLGYTAAYKSTETVTVTSPRARLVADKDAKGEIPATSRSARSKDRLQR